MIVRMENSGLQETSGVSGIFVGWRGVRVPFRLQCCSCSYEPVDATIAPTHCPKCMGGAWEWYAMPRRMLMEVRQVQAIASMRARAVTGRFRAVAR